MDSGVKQRSTFNMKKISSILYFFTIYTVWAQDFSYEGNDGPANWGLRYQTCVGKHQSPINIDEHRVQSVKLSPLQFFGFNLPRIATLNNNGHTVLMKTKGSKDALLTGGPLGDRFYIFEQLHFHWGENDREGSEDKINNQSFAMELHAVFYNSLYGSAERAVEHSDGLTVLAYFLEAGEESNPHYKELVEALPNIENIGKQYTIGEKLLLESILMTNHESIQNYFTYNGSLTTPPCSEVVTWIDFKQPHILSHKQIAAFRRIRSEGGEVVTHNFRPVQPLEDRIVYQNIPEMGQYIHRDQNHDHRNHHHPLEHSSAQFNGKASIITIVIAASLMIVLNR